MHKQSRMNRQQYDCLQPTKQQLKIKPYPGSQMGLDIGCILHITANARVSKTILLINCMVEVSLELYAFLTG